MLKAYLKYRKQAINQYKIHSPFVFEFYTKVVKPSKVHTYAQLSAIRSKIDSDYREIEVTDLGQGSKKMMSTRRKVSSIARVQGISTKYGKFLAQIIDYYGLKNVVELGTSLGIGTAYLSTHAKKVVTIEGCENIQQLAKEYWKSYHADKVTYILGNFDDVLESVLEEIDTIDIAYIDGNHGYEATLNYFDYFMKVGHNNTFMVFDDINWSEGMRKAWDEIILSEEIHLSMEFYRMGIVMKRQEMAKEHFVLKF